MRGSTKFRTAPLLISHLLRQQLRGGAAVHARGVPRRRNRLQASVLALGYSFVFTDADIAWFRNPLLRMRIPQSPRPTDMGPVRLSFYETCLFIS